MRPQPTPHRPSAVRVRLTKEKPRGVVQNILFENFHIEGAASGPSISQSSGNNGIGSSTPAGGPASTVLTGGFPGSFAGTSNMLVSNVAFVNFTGYLAGTSGNRSAQISCSTRNPCYNIDLRGIGLQPTRNATVEGAVGTCAYIEPGGVHGMTGSGCS